MDYSELWQRAGARKVTVGKHVEFVFNRGFHSVAIVLIPECVIVIYLVGDCLLERKEAPTLAQANVILTKMWGRYEYWSQ